MKPSGWHRKRSTAAERARTLEYGRAEHREARARLKLLVDSGQAICCRCGQWIAPHSPWHADHTEDRSGYLGASHARCNLRAAASKGARMKNGGVNGSTF